MHEEHRRGIRYLEEVTFLLQQVRTAHPTAGVYEAADYQWWWRVPRRTDDLPQLFWFDETGRPQAAVVVTAWGHGVGLDPITMPDPTPDWIAHIVERGLAHASQLGLGPVEIVVAGTDEVMADVLGVHGFRVTEDEMVDSWLPGHARPSISPLHQDYRLASRLDTLSAPHHMRARSGPDVEERLRQTSLYRADLDLVVLDADDQPAAYGLFWFDPETATGLVEPMRTEDRHQRRGLGRHVLTTGINRLVDLGAQRIKVAYRHEDPVARALYTGAGFSSARQCVVMTRHT